MRHASRFTVALILLVSSAHAQDAAPRFPAEAATRALNLVRAEKYAEAEPLLRDLVAGAPHEGRLKETLGRALLGLGKHDEAVRILEEAVAIGRSPGHALYNIACAHALAGRAPMALDALKRALAAGFDDFQTLDTDTDLDAIRKDPGFDSLALVTRPRSDSREDKWRADLDTLIARVWHVHFRPDAHTTRAAFTSRVEALKSRVASLSDQRITMEIQGILASLGDGHTNAYGAIMGHGDFSSPVFPVSLYLFSDGLFVRASYGDAGPLAGCRVTTFGNLTAEEAIAKVTPYLSVDNAMGVRSLAPVALAASTTHEALGTLTANGQLTITGVKADGTTVSVTLSAMPLGDARSLPSTHMNAGAPTPAPLYQRNSEKPLWYEHLKDINAVYFKFDSVLNPPGSTLAAFLDELFAFVDSSGADRLIIDVRNNGGGNNTLIRPLINHLARRPKLTAQGRLYVVIGRETFSAAQNAANRLEAQFTPIFVGEPTGSRINFVGETTMVQLPATGFTFSCSSLYWQDGFPSDARPWIAPLLNAELSSKDYAANRDPALEAIIADIKAQRP